VNHSHVVAQLSADIEAIISGLPAALAHLNEWTGEIPSPSSGSSAPEDDQPSKPTGDHAMRLQLSILARIRLAAAAAIDVFADLDGVRLPVEVVHEAHSLAVLRWAAKRLRTDANDVPARKLDNLSRLVAHARSLVVEYQPTAPVAPAGCRIHARVGDTVAVDQHNYGARKLCTTCGTFARKHDADPTPRILHEWSKGRHATRAMIAEAESLAKKKRKEKRAKKKR
jgi:hypothetical protein